MFSELHCVFAKNFSIQKKPRKAEKSILNLFVKHPWQDAYRLYLAYADVECGNVT